MAETVASNVELLALIFNLNVNCFEDLFDWLSLKDLFALRRTCKRMKNIVDYYIRLNYSLKLRIKRHGLHGLDIEHLFQNNPNGFEMVTHLSYNSKINTHLKCIQKFLGQVESVFVEAFNFERGDVYEDFLKHCTYLKHLKIRGTSSRFSLMGNGNQWLHQYYPKLEHFEFYRHPSEPSLIQYVALKTFFEKNPNIRILSISFHCLQSDWSWFHGSNLKFDQLNVFGGPPIYANAHDFRFLNQLHSQGFYQRLHVGVTRSRWNDFGHVLLSAPDRLSIINELHIPELAPLANTKELYSFQLAGCDLMTTANNKLPNIRYIFLRFANIFDDVLSLVRVCSKLKQIHIKQLRSNRVSHQNNGIIDLCILNTEREKLANACKTTIFVDEEIYLANRWANRINFTFIELKRDHDMSWELMAQF